MSGATTFFSRTNGVFPIACNTESRTWSVRVTSSLPPFANLKATPFVPHFLLLAYPQKASQSANGIAW
jgi:hypothetical protein